MNTAFKIHSELEKHFKNFKSGDELKDCNFISAVLGGIPLSMSDDLLRQLVKLLQIHVGEIGQQIHISQLQTLDDIIDSLIHTLDNVTKLGALSANGAFCKDANSNVPTPDNGATPSGGINGTSYTGSQPGTYNVAPNYGNSPVNGNDNNVSPIYKTIPTVSNNVKKILNNSNFFDKRFGYTGRKATDQQALANNGNTPDDYVASLLENAKDALANQLAQTLSSQLGIPISAQAAKMFVDARFGTGATSGVETSMQENTPMAAYAKDVDKYVDKLS